MSAAAITSYIDVAQLVLYAFFIFFAGLVWHLRQEDRREGYPLMPSLDGGNVAGDRGFPFVPSPKTFRLADGTEVQKPDFVRDTRILAATPTAKFAGAPLVPDGDAMRDGVGPAAFALRRDVPDSMAIGGARILPSRLAEDFRVSIHDGDPRGLTVVGADRVVAGTVIDYWADRAETSLRYLEVELAAGGVVLLPIYFAQVRRKRGVVLVNSILASQFEGVPRLKNPDQVTLLEEDMIMAYYGGGKLYAVPSRQEPLL